jgi:hypothetical protein
MSLASRCRFRTTTRCTWDPLGDRVFSAWLPVCYLDEQDGVLLSDVGARENRAIDAAFEPFLVRSSVFERYGPPLRLAPQFPDPGVVPTSS